MGTTIPPVWPDEVLFFSPAFEFYSTGILKTEVLNGLIPGMEKATLWMPPVFMLYLSAVFQFFPQDIFIARMASSIMALASALILYKFLSNWKISKKIKLFIIVLLLSDFLFIKTTHSSRMESLCLFFAFCGFYFLSTLRLEKKVRPSKIFLSGLFLSLSFLSHPFGAVYGIISLYLLFLKRSFKIKNIFLLFLGFLVPLLFWIQYILPNYDLFLLQFGAQFSRKTELFTTFSQLIKFKIILSSFRFPIFRVGLFFLLFVGLIMHWKKLKIQFGEIFQFSLIWLILIIIFLYISSESWYVVYLIPPISILSGLFFERKDLISKMIWGISIGLNGIILIWILLQNFIILNTPQKTEEFFSLIEKEIQYKNRIYLQSIPDPYFYLKKKYPEKTFLEFMPGELSIQPQNFQDTVKKQEAFLFYNEDLINNYIKIYLKENSDSFERKVIEVDTGNSSELTLKTFLYLKK